MRTAAHPRMTTGRTTKRLVRAVMVMIMTKAMATTPQIGGIGLWAIGLGFGGLRTTIIKGPMATVLYVNSWGLLLTISSSFPNRKEYGTYTLGLN
jgi:hypothetical protein